MSAKQTFDFIFNLLWELEAASTGYNSPNHGEVCFCIKNIYYTFVYLPSKYNSIVLKIDSCHFIATIELKDIWFFFNIEDNMARILINGGDMVIKINKPKIR